MYRLFKPKSPLASFSFGCKIARVKTQNITLILLFVFGPLMWGQEKYSAGYQRNSFAENKNTKTLISKEAEDSFQKQAPVIPNILNTKSSFAITFSTIKNMVSKINKAYFIELLVFIILSFLLFKQIQKIKIYKKEIKIAEDKGANIIQEIKIRNKQIKELSIHITEKNKILNELKSKIKTSLPDELKNDPKNELILYINENLEQDNDHDLVDANIKEHYSSFLFKINDLFPDLTKQEKRILVLIRLGYSSKQIGSKLNVSPTSIDNRRCFIRKKLKVPKGGNLNSFIFKI